MPISNEGCTLGKTLSTVSPCDEIGRVTWVRIPRHSATHSTGIRPGGRSGATRRWVFTVNQGLLERGNQKTLASVRWATCTHSSMNIGMPSPNFAKGIECNAWRFSVPLRTEPISTPGLAMRIFSWSSRPLPTALHFRCFSACKPTCPKFSVERSIWRKPPPSVTPMSGPV